MAYSPIATPTTLQDPGILFWAPLGSSLPTNTVSGSVFTDTWPVAWVPLGMTEAGSTFTPATTTSPVTAAETFYPLNIRTTDISVTWAFDLKNFTATNLSRALNGATVTVTGSGASTLSQIDPPALGAEVRAMLGWESLDSTVRIVAFQFLNTGSLAFAMQKAPATGNIPFSAELEKPSSTQPYRMWTAGAARA